MTKNAAQQIVLVLVGALVSVAVASVFPFSSIGWSHVGKDWGVAYWRGGNGMKLRTRLFLLSFCSIAHAQNMPASDNDLHAAYCIEISRFSISTYQQAIKETSNGKFSDTPDKLNAELRVAEANLRKFQAYLVPRLQYIDATTLLGASATAKSDLQRALTSPPDLKILQAKFNLCKDTSSWLPF
jgi:hypothetical protein